MKTLILASALAAVTLPVMALPVAAIDPPAPTTTALSPPPAPPQSSLAGAASRANATRPKKKSKLSITNETIKKSGGHITTYSGTSAALPVIPPTPTGKTPEQMVAEANAQRKAAEEAQKKKDVQERLKRQQRAAANMEDESLDNEPDPSVTEHKMQSATGPAPATSTTSTTEQKPPR
jgi:hypothetical protein